MQRIIFMSYCLFNVDKKHLRPFIIFFVFCCFLIEKEALSDEIACQHCLLTSKNIKSNQSNPYQKMFNELMLDKEYEKALAILEKAFDDNDAMPEESLTSCFMKYHCMVYLHLMLGQEEAFLKQQDEISRRIMKQHWSNTASVRVNYQAVLYAKLGQPDKMLKECENQIQNNLLDLTNYQAYILAAGALLVKENIGKAKGYLSIANIILNEFHENTKKSEKPVIIDDGFVDLIKIFDYY